MTFYAQTGKPAKPHIFRRYGLWCVLPYRPEGDCLIGVQTGTSVEMAWFGAEFIYGLPKFGRRN